MIIMPLPRAVAIPGLACRGVINLLRQLLDDSIAPLAPEIRQAVQAGRLPVPTSASLLAPAGQCLYASSAGSRAIMSRWVQA